MHITKVQQWVASALLLVVGLTPAVALAWVSLLTDAEEGARDRAVGLWVMSPLWGLATMIGVLLIHKHSLVSAWLLVGLLPGAVAAPFLF
ncbi:MAG TPA: hypothetical protein VHG70_06080 [Nocardioidaceae bacterium]|nr:hypothetical protein [Nocardioidaceae bacterium]